MVRQENRLKHSIARILRRFISKVKSVQTKCTTKSFKNTSPLSETREKIAINCILTRIYSHGVNIFD